MAQEDVPESLDEAFEALEFRFLLNLPEQELETADRLFFQIEQAHWFYEDFLADKHSHLRHFSELRVFAQEMFNRCDTLKPLRSHFGQLYDQFREYRARIPVYGAVLLNQDMTRVLLVKGFKGNSWGYPKGKVNQHEEDVTCAVREVYEEIGYNCEGMIHPKDYVEFPTKKGQGKYMKLFIVRGVDESFNFGPRVRKEIAGIQFFNVSELPFTKEQANKSGNKFWGLHHFTSQLVKWIQKQRAQDRRARSNGKTRGNEASSDKKTSINKDAATPPSVPEPAPSTSPSTPALDSHMPKLFAVDVSAVMASMEPFLTA
ncbi:mRNA decapping complex subunit 2 [Hondaea fermentalgiana]|uniref:mRNA decapping complex subunit 2 n=1 Tax=Hondaea fermentalgiana TaxID=2315210 RepID=A0A2R5GEN7_9STRA|nr:mRNA decapping complex subunit 2 [Hondaea fermentalgiana]|eukprot:GBG29035.1 mRNA decapping complex subunit 2 [Hondaea fermentalgiana]